MNLSVKGIYISRHNKINSPNTHLFFKSIKTSLKIPKGYIIRSRKSKDRQHNGQKKRTKGQLTTINKTLHIKTEDRVTRATLKTGGEVRCCALKG